MQRFSTMFFLSALLIFAACTPNQAAVNPDPNHTHADFAVWLYGSKVDFSIPEYMSGSSDENDVDHTKHDPYLHLHDGNGHVIHRHKPGLTFGDFLRTIGVTADDLGCMTIGVEETCASYNYQWRFIVNGEDISVSPPDDLQKNIGATLQKAYAYVFADGDTMLLSLTDIKSSQDEARREWKEMTNDACLYSKTCPERGEPPPENCVADPTVPCTQ